MNIIPLQDKYEYHTGRFADFVFNKVYTTDVAYIYKVEVYNSLTNKEIMKAEGKKVVHTHYEVLLRKKKYPVCLDFEKRIYSKDTFKEAYPTDEDFGTIAWTTDSFDKALSIIQQKS